MMRKRIVYIVLGFILLLIINSLFGPYILEAVMKEEQYKAELKANLFTIQIAVEKYAMDHEGNYPPSLLGGDKEGWAYYNANRTEGAEYLYDPLIEGGYMTSYPINPYMRVPFWVWEDRRAISEFRDKIKDVGEKLFDPRFGFKGDKMGNVLMEPYYFFKPPEPIPEDYPRLCPGQFYYRAIGQIDIPDDYDGSTIFLLEDIMKEPYSRYILGAFSSIMDIGKDSIRWTDGAGNIPDEFPYISDSDLKSMELYRSGGFMDVKTYLRLPEVFGWENRQLVYWSPDGIRDGVIIVLSPGQEREGA